MVTLLRNLRNLGPLLMQRFLLRFLLKLCNVSCRSENCPASSGVRCGFLHIDIVVPVLFVTNAVLSPLGHLGSLSEAARSCSTGHLWAPCTVLGPCTCPSANTAVLITVALQESSKCGGHRAGSEASSRREGDGPKPRSVYGRPLPTNADCSRSCLGRPGLV